MSGYDLRRASKEEKEKLLAVVAKEQFQYPPAPELPVEKPIIDVERMRRRLIRKQLSLRYEGLSLYEELPLSAEVHRCNSFWRLLEGCLAGEQKIYDPVLRRSRRIDSIHGTFHVLSKNPLTGEDEAREIPPPFIKAHGELYRFHLSNGASLSATLGHRVLNSQGEWVSMLEAWRQRLLLLCLPSLAVEAECRTAASCPAPPHRYTGTSLRGEPSTTTDRDTSALVPPRGERIAAAARRPLAFACGHLPSVECGGRISGAGCELLCSAAAPDSQGGCPSGRRFCDEQSPRPIGISRETFPLPSDGRRHTDARCSGRLGGEGRTGQYTHPASLRRPSTAGCACLTEGQSALLGFRTDDTGDEWCFLNSETVPQSRRLPAFLSHTDAPASPCLDKFWDETSHPRLFKWSNSNSQCSIIAIERIADNGSIWDISVPPHANYVAAGLYNANSNRAGKSLTGLVEGGRALTGTDPYDKYIKTGGRALFVGLKLEVEIARMYRTLFVQGAFKIIQDEITRLWRAVRYDRDNPTVLQAYDLAYREKWKDAPPLVPPRMVHNIAWEDHGKDVPKLIALTNGWKAIWLTAMGRPEQGEHYGFVLFDEEMPNPEFYKEALRGLIRLHEPVAQRPKGIWSATAQIANPELVELRDKAMADPDSDFCRRFVFLIDNNPYFTEEARREFYEGLSESDRQTRYFGVPAIEQRYVYGCYSPMGSAEHGTGHGCEKFDIDPSKYSRYVYLDPSITRCALLFVAVDNEEKFLTVYDGLAIMNCTPQIAARAIKERENGYHFEACVCDQQMGKQRLNSREETTVAKEYFQAMKDAGIEFSQLGGLQGFIPGNNNMETRTITTRQIMEVRGFGPYVGTCKLRVMRGCCPALDKEIARAVTDPKNPNKRLKQNLTHRSGTQCDLLDVLEYCACHDPGYRIPEPTDDEESNPVYEHFLAKKRSNLFYSPPYPLGVR